MVTGPIRTASQDFRRARRKADIQEVLARLSGKATTLLSFEEVRQKLKAEEAENRILEEIPLDAIVGSVGRYKDFTRSFLPRQESDSERWARVKETVETIGLSPIDVFQIDLCILSWMDIIGYQSLRKWGQAISRQMLFRYIRKFR